MEVKTNMVTKEYEVEEKIAIYSVKDKEFKRKVGYYAQHNFKNNRR